MSFWLYLFTEFASIPDEQIERLANWEIPPSKRSGNYQHSTLSKSKYWYHVKFWLFLTYTIQVCCMKPVLVCDKYRNALH